MTFSEQSEIQISFSIKQEATNQEPNDNAKDIKLYKAKVSITDRDDGTDLLSYEHENIAVKLINSVVERLSLSLWRRELNKKPINLSQTEITFALKKERYNFYFDLTNIKRAKYHLHVVPDKDTINNVQTMIQRALQFFRECGCIVEYECKFPGSKKKYISKHFGNLMTPDTIWKVHSLKTPPGTWNFMWLLRQYVIGKQSTNSELFLIKNLGIFHARFNKIYILKIEDIPAPIMDSTNQNVIQFMEKRFPKTPTPNTQTLAN